MFTVRRWRAFTVSKYHWTVHVECQAPRLDVVGHAEGVDFDLFWQWVATNLYGGVHDESGEPLGDPYAVEPLGQQVRDDPATYTAERMAFLLLTAFRDLSPLVRSVRVLRDTFSGRPSGVHDCTVTAHDAEPVTASELVAALRSYNDALRESSPAIVRELLRDALRPWLRSFARLNGLTLPVEDGEPLAATGLAIRSEAGPGV